ncbi:MAG: large protein, partial [Segetibacter sp.]|nr:large protein [Segetibacter sp.]
MLFSYILFQSQYEGFAQVTSSTDYFRSRITGNWNSAASWESSADGSTNWIPSTMVPTEAANTITIRNGHTVTINTNATTDQVVIANGGILEQATGSSTSLTVNNGAGNDIIVQSGGIFKHNITGLVSSLPSFTASATIEIQSGGILEAANNNGTPSDYAVTSSTISANILWADSSIFNWNVASNPPDGVTYFPSGNAIPIFRVSQSISIGNTTATVINGILEANANINLSSTGSKTFRNGIVGTGAVAATAINGGQFIVNGTTAKLGGGTLTLNNNGLSISSATTMTLISNKT